MQAIPSALQARFEEHLRTKTILDHLQWSYKKWLRYYLDYCEKYHFSPKDRSSLPRFIKKLNEKKQTGQQQGQATEAIKIYYEVLGQNNQSPKVSPPQPISLQNAVPLEDGKPEFIRESSATANPPQRFTPGPSRDSISSSSNYSHSRTEKVSGITPVARIGTNNAAASQVKQESGASWKSEYSRLADEISVRHYSKKTLQTYQGWTRKFQTFTQSKKPELLSTNDVKEFLTFLAVKKRWWRALKIRRSIPCYSFTAMF